MYALSVRMNNKHYIEEFNAQELIKLLGYYLKTLNSKSSNVNKIRYKEEYLAIREEYKNKIIETIAELADYFNISFKAAMLSFDRLFKDREKNKNKTSYLEFLDPIDRNDELLNFKKEALTISVGTVILDMVNSIKNDHIVKQKFINYANLYCDSPVSNSV